LRDDVFPCSVAFRELMARGMRFAPLEVAARFSFEQPCGDCPQSIGAVFGFHGRLTPETQHMTDCLFRRVNGGKLRLIVNYYRDPHYLRRVEIDECLRANCGPGVFDEVLAICKMDTMPAYRRMKLWRLGVDRATFGVHFQAADETTAKADVNVIANADIEFTPAACDLLRRLPRGEFWCLSRWENPDHPQPPSEAYRYCQDVWAWRGACKIDLAAASFPLGYPGCENRLAYLAHEAGYRVANPSLSVKTIHVHQSAFRRYPATDHAVKCKDRIPPPYVYVEPHKIGETPRITIDLDGPNLPEAEEAMAAGTETAAGT
jgi:hypothetical protein